jgi:hypothetical protein
MVERDEGGRVQKGIEGGGAAGILYRGEREIESRACIGAACGPEAVLRWLVADGAARRGDECC